MIEYTDIKTTKAYLCNSEGYAGGECCIRCGKFMPDATRFVNTNQGCYPIGADCEARALKAGEITAADIEIFEQAVA